MKFFDRVKTTTTTAGTGPVTCSATAVSSELRTLAGAGGAVGDVFPYAIGIAGSAEWECGLGTITAINSGAVTFSRTPTASSNGNALVNFSAGTKEVVCTPLGATLTKWENGTSTRVVFTSSICVSDSNLDMTPTLGTDQTAKLQALLDFAQNGPLMLVWDGSYSVYSAETAPGAGILKIRSNTTIKALPGCGAVAMAGVSRPIFMNANPVRTAAEIVDRNIAIEGGIWHGNRAQQAGKPTLMDFVGVDGLTFTGGIEFRKAGGFTWHGANVYHVLFDHFRIDFGDGNTTVNTDGIHFNGPARYLTVKNGEIFNCADDPIAFNADDAWGEANFTGPFDNMYGPIEDGTVENITFRNVYYGIRLLSGDSRIDNFKIGNIRGQTGAYTVVMDNYINPTKALKAGPGNFGNIEFDGIHTKNAYVDYNWGQMSIHVNAKVEQISFRNVTKSHFNNALFPIIRYGEKADIDQATIHGLKSWNYNGGTYLTEQVHVVAGAKIRMMGVYGCMFSSNSAVSGYPIKVDAGAAIEHFIDSSNVARGFTGVLGSAAGTITNLISNGSAAPVVTPSTWNLQSGTGWSEDTSNPSKLTYTGPVSGVVASAKKTTLDSYGGNVQMSARLRFNGSTTPNLHAALIVRGKNIVPWSGVQSACYIDFQLNKNGDGSTGGISTNAGNAHATVQFETGVDYDVVFTAKGTLFTTSVKRVSDNFYLQSNGTFAATQANVFSANDTNFPAVSGEWGVYAFTDANASVQFTNITIAAAP